MSGTTRIRPGRTRRFVSIVTAVAVVVALGLGAGGFGAHDAQAAPLQLTGATLEWSVNDESNTGAFNGQCNFMSAGESDGSSSTYRATDANATVLKATAAGGFAPVSDYSTRCRDANGVTVTPGGTARLGQKVRYTNGTGTVDPVTGEVEITWTGTFSVNFYGQLVPYWFSDPVLRVGTDGRGTVTATVGGYASSLDNPDVRELITPVPGVVIANLSGVASTDSSGFVVTPDYAGVQVDGTSTPQIRAFPGWGSWPVGLVQVMERLGIGSYWYTAGGSADGRKPPAPMTVSYGTGAVPPTSAPTSSTALPGATTSTIAAPTTSTPSSTTSAPTATTVTHPSVTTTTPAGTGGIGITAVVPPGTDVEGGGEEQPGAGLPANTFAWRIDTTTGGVTMSRHEQGGDAHLFSGELAPVTVIDTRSAATGWSLSGQVSDFSGGLSGRYLGWTPKVTTPGAGALAGEAVPSGFLAGRGLSQPALLASAPAGRAPGSATLGASLDLRVPSTTPAGTYSATLTITALG